MTLPAGPGGGRYLLDLDTRDLPRFTADVLVVGAGIAGLTAALVAADSANVLVLLKDPFSQCNTALAQGGIAAALAEDDSPALHGADTLRVGGGLCDEAVVRAVVDGGPAAIQALIDVGGSFDGRDGEGGKDFALGREAGHSRSRIVHANGDATGAECSRALVDAVSNHPCIHVRPGFFVLDLLTTEDRVVGVIARRPHGELVAVMARSVVLATGGAGRLFRETTNARGATGDGIAAAYRAGAELRDIEFVQFHPTTLYLAGSDRVLVTESVRGDGARVIDDRGERFLKAAHADAELAPRDVVARAIMEQVSRPDVRDVFLDMRHWPRGHARERFPGLTRLCRRYGLDPQVDPIPVRPAAHYFIGGVATDLDGRTNLAGLFACGETACSGLHGANRLASNSLLEGLVLGRRTGLAAAREQADRFGGDIAHRTSRRESRSDIDIEDLRKSLVSRMWRDVGIMREAAGLSESIEAIRRWRLFLGQVNLFGRAGFELENLLVLGGIVAAAALRREESRGTHARRDFPDRDDARFGGSLFWRRGAEPEFRILERTSG